jgi:acyl carrier protein
MSAPSRAGFIAEMLAWLNQRLVPQGVVVDAETPLFRSGAINSIRILELIAWTERATGRTIPDREIRMDNFQTIARIAEVFAPEQSHVAG